MTSKRMGVLLALLVLSLVAAVSDWSPAGGSSADDDLAVQRVRPAAPVATATPATAPPAAAQSELQKKALSAAAPRASAAVEAKLFAVRDWRPKPELPKPVAPKPPPLRLKFLGKTIEGDVVTVFLDDGTRTLLVRAGDRIGTTYRIETVSPTSMTLTYIPLNEPQRLNFGSAN
jgi:hypothetical protein